MAARRCSAFFSPSLISRSHASFSSHTPALSPYRHAVGISLSSHLSPFSVSPFSSFSHSFSPSSSSYQVRNDADLKCYVSSSSSPPSPTCRSPSVLPSLSSCSSHPARLLSCLTPASTASDCGRGTASGSTCCLRSGSMEGGDVHASVRCFSTFRSALLSSFDRDIAVSTNRTLSHSYEVEDSLICGLSLLTTEVKSMRQGHCDVSAADVVITREEVTKKYNTSDGWTTRTVVLPQLYLDNCNVPEWKGGYAGHHGPLRRRRLLAKRREINQLMMRVEKERRMLVPKRIFFKDGRYAKVEVCVCKPKPKVDKREKDASSNARKEIRQNITLF